MSEVVLVALLKHGDGHDEHEGHEPALGIHGRVLQHQSQQQVAEEVEVGAPPELLEQVAREEGEHGVLGRVHRVVLERGLNTLRVGLDAIDNLCKIMICRTTVL